MKTSKAFRLSAQALEALGYLAEKTGTNETAIVEMALAHYRQAFDNSRMEELKKILPDQSIPQDRRKELLERVSMELPIVNKKKRKRKH